MIGGRWKRPQLTDEAQKVVWQSKEHYVPDPTCTCGMYAGINMQHLIDINYIQRGIHGEVSPVGAALPPHARLACAVRVPQVLHRPGEHDSLPFRRGAAAPQDARRVRRGHLRPAGARSPRRAADYSAVDAGLRLQRIRASSFSSRSARSGTRATRRSTRSPKATASRCSATSTAAESAW